MSLFDVKELLEKYKAGTCSPEELQALENWYESWKHPAAEEVEWQPEEELAQELLQDFREVRRRKDALFSGESRQTWWRAAAVLAPIIGIGAILWFSRPSTPAAGDNAPVLAVAAKKPDSKRFILLPDSSTVVLREGSSLKYPEQFTGSTREVTLIGEGYFDIRHQPGKPFLIHSGKVVTTVLGTAFNIKAYPDQPSVTVTVKKGKVKIEEEKGGKLLGILTPDQQIVYNPEKVETLPVKAEETVAWLRKGMDFNAVPFEDIARQINEQYQVDIRFANEVMKQCRIRATFEGTETLDKVLFVLCTVSNASYTISGNEVVISGEGCSDK
ncbi:FecR family protein [Chitinophaga lutea]|uniref:FecR family protein n=1 Tax=Chitinophaga lutea TaxID=2488634 RepID=A0A3N4QBP3_9BACT|nr:FecR family protein [Chitinophaga lutea]RPE13410.1 FecR family protein [Chitinophaga lutea]